MPLQICVTAWKRGAMDVHRNAQAENTGGQRQNICGKDGEKFCFDCNVETTWMCFRVLFLHAQYKGKVLKEFNVLHVQVFIQMFAKLQSIAEITQPYVSLKRLCKREL